MIGTQRIQEGNQVAPEAAEHRLPTVVAEADVHGAFVQDAVQHMIDRFRGPRRILRIPCDAGFIQLYGIGFNGFQLAAQHHSQIHG